MFDYLMCEYPIDAPENVKQWQTKDTPSQYLDQYKIDAQGSLWHYTNERLLPGVKGLGRVKVRTEFEWVKLEDFRGEICFSGFEVINGKDDYEKLWEYSALFDDGRIINIKRISPAAIDGNGA